MFWQQVAQPFFQSNNDVLLEHDANEILLKHGKSVVAELLPYHPIYCDLLSQHCQQQLGQVAPCFFELVQTLQTIGFYKTRFIDVFDAGPVWRFKQEDLSHFFETIFCDKKNANLQISSNYSLYIKHQESNHLPTHPPLADNKIIKEIRWSL